MATSDNERYIRHLSLLGNVGLLVFRYIVGREASRRGQTLDKILNDNRNKFKRNRKHSCELFSQGSEVNADPRTWSMSLLFLVIKELFWNDLSCDERSSLRTLRNLRDEVDGTQVSLTEDEYATNRTDIKQAFKKLESGLSEETQRTIQDAINSSGLVEIDVQTTLQQIRELGEYRPSMLDDLDTVLNTVSLASAQVEIRCHNTQDRASQHGRDSSEINQSSSFEKLTTTGGRDENVFEIHTSEDSLENGENVQDATFFEDLKTAPTGDVNLQAVHETAPENNRDSHKIQDECRGEVSSSFEELEPDGIRNEMTMPKRVCTCNPGEQENLEAVESVNGNVTVNRDRESAVISSEWQSSGTTEESYDHLIDLNAFVSDIGNGQRIPETQQSSHQDSVQVGRGEWLDPYGNVNPQITQQNPEAEELQGMVRDMVVIQKNGGQRLRISIDLQIRIKIRSNNPNLADEADHALCRIINEILVQTNLVDAQQETHAGTQHNSYLAVTNSAAESANACPTQQETDDGAQHNSYQAVTNSAAESANAFPTQQETQGGTQHNNYQAVTNSAAELANACPIQQETQGGTQHNNYQAVTNSAAESANAFPTQQETQGGTQHNNYLAVTNSVAELANAFPTQQGAENFLSERATSRRGNDSDILERIRSNLAGDIERNPELIRLCFGLLFRLSQLGGVYLISAGKGCVLLLIKCKSVEALVEFSNFYYDDSFQEILDNIARTLESQKGGEIRIHRRLTQESIENLKSTIEEESKKLPKERMGYLRAKCAGPADVFCTSRYLQTDGKDQCEQIQTQLSGLVGGEVSLSMYVDPLDKKQALDLTPDLTDLIGALNPRRTTTQRRIAV